MNDAEYDAWYDHYTVVEDGLLWLYAIHPYTYEFKAAYVIGNAY